MISSGILKFDDGFLDNKFTLWNEILLAIQIELPVLHACDNVVQTKG